MAQSVFSVRMDDKVKKKFNELCDDFGMSMSTAINLFAKTVIKEGRIPFSIVSKNAYDRIKTESKGMELIKKINKDYIKKGGKELTLDEINKIIYG